MARWNLFQSRSILGLILSGFALVTLPLILGLWLAAARVEGLAEQSQVVVERALKAARDGQLLYEHLTSLERSARQYLVVREQNPDLLQSYRGFHRDFRQTLEQLRLLDLEPAWQTLLDQIERTERELFAIFSRPREQPVALEARLDEFGTARNLAVNFRGQAEGWARQETRRMQQLAEEATRLLTWLVAALVPGVLAMAAVFAALIARPLRRMSRAIQRLGAEDFQHPIHIKGPRDLETLGQRLDWLRLRLKELEDQKIRFLRHMSHELKTPLTALREGAELLADEVLGPLGDEQREVAGIMRSNALQLQRLIEDLLSFNQTLARNMAFHGAPVNLKALVEEVVELQRLAWKARDLQIDMHLKPVTLVADREKLLTITDNLLSNAIKFTPVGEHIEIELTTQDREVHLTVHDSGPGFHPQDRERVFEAFYQGRIVAEGHIKGTGLGLAIAREFATLHGGRLEVVDGPGPGGRVRLSLPLEREEPT